MTAAQAARTEGKLVLQRVRKHGDLSLRGARLECRLDTAHHFPQDSRESVCGLSLQLHDMASFLDQNGDFPLSKFNLRRSRRGRVITVSARQFTPFQEQPCAVCFLNKRRHRHPPPSFLSSTRPAPPPDQLPGLLRPSVSKLDSIRTGCLPVPKHHHRFPARSHGSTL